MYLLGGGVGGIRGILLGFLSLLGAKSHCMLHLVDDPLGLQIRRLSDHIKAWHALWTNCKALAVTAQQSKTLSATTYPEAQQLAKGTSAGT